MMPLRLRLSPYKKEIYSLNRCTLQMSMATFLIHSKPLILRLYIMSCVLSVTYLLELQVILCLLSVDDNVTCILDFDALKMVVSRSSPKMNSRGMIHFPSLRLILPRSFTMLG